jgi:hypothetical protein
MSPNATLRSSLRTRGSVAAGPSPLRRRAPTSLATVRRGHRGRPAAPAPFCRRALAEGCCRRRFPGAPAPQASLAAGCKERGPPALGSQARAQALAGCRPPSLPPAHFLRFFVSRRRLLLVEVHEPNVRSCCCCCSCTILMCRLLNHQSG